MAETTEIVPLPRVPLGDAVEVGFDWLGDVAGGFFDAVTTGLGALVDGVTDLLVAVPPVVLVLLLAVVATGIRSVRFGLVSLVGLLLVVSIELWVEFLETLALILAATAAAAVIGIPLGILAARSDRTSTVFKPVLDLMQTMPPFVYLIPAVAFFGIGTVPALITTVVFALPPAVRLTELGIRQVDGEVVEAGTAFGGSSWQILRGIQLPLALTTIMAGVNQVIMLALSMAVIGGFIGAPGLGAEVVRAISSLNLSLGFEAGLSVVILAIFLDRLTAAFGSGTPRLRLARVKGLLNRGSTSTGDDGAGLSPEAQVEAERQRSRRPALR